MVVHNRDSYGNIIEFCNKNLFLYYRMYTINFTTTHSMNTLKNLIDKNMYGKVDEEGQEYHMMINIVEHRRGGSVLIKE